jgi:hypothetical protein
MFKTKSFRSTELKGASVLTEAPFAHKIIA